MHATRTHHSFRCPAPLNLPIITHCQECARKLKEPKTRGFFEKWILCAKCERNGKDSNSPC
jgi:hydrogenase maturation factor HypF (carbamoyltransferase family)